MKQEDTRQKILARALELFSVHGYDAVSVGQIAAAVAMLTSVEVDDVRAEIEAPLRDLIRWGFLTY